MWLLPSLTNWVTSVLTARFPGALTVILMGCVLSVLGICSWLSMAYPALHVLLIVQSALPPYA